MMTATIQNILDRAREEAERGYWDLNAEIWEPTTKEELLQEGFELNGGLSWANSFKDKRLTLEQSAFISGWIDELPKTENLAETLALLTWRAMATHGE